MHRVHPSWMKACVVVLSFALVTSLFPTSVLAQDVEVPADTQTDGGEPADGDGSTVVTNPVVVPTYSGGSSNYNVTIDGSIDTYNTIDEYMGYALEVSSYSQDATAEVTGDVTAHTAGNGVEAVRAIADQGKKTTVHVGGDVTADNHYNGINDNGGGVFVNVKSDQAEADVTVDGEVYADGFYAEGISAFMNKGTATVVTGDVYTGGSYESTGIKSETYWYSLNENAGPSNGGTLDITTGSVTVEGKQGDGRNNLAYGIWSEYNDGVLNIHVGGDLTVSSDTGEHKVVGAHLSGSETSTNNIVVEGTISAKDAGVVNNMSASAVDITVWKVESDNLFVKETADNTYVEDTELAAAVNYIIKIEQPQEGNVLAARTIALNALRQVAGFDVANKGDKVYLTLTDAGYYIKAAYNGKGDAVALQKDEKGWYVEVPEGGGVYLSAELGKNSYQVTFQDEDGTQLQQGLVEYLDTPTYTGSTPTKEATVANVYEFAGWNPEINPVTGEVTYTATYRELVRNYAISFDLAGGTLNGATGTVRSLVGYGSALTLPKPTRAGYTFLYWEGSRYDAGESYTVEGDHSFTAIWEKDPESQTTPKASDDGSQTPLATGAQAATRLPQTSDPTPATTRLALAAGLGIACMIAGTRMRRRRWATATARHMR